MDNFSCAVLRAPDPLGYSTAKKVNTAVHSPGDRTSFRHILTNIGPFLPFWSGLVRVESIHPDQKTRAMTGLVRVVRVVRVKSKNIHMRACARVSIFFLHIISFLTLKFEFIRNHPDHPDQANARLHFRPDRRPDQSRTTRTRPMPERVSAFFGFVGGGRWSKTRPKWSDNPRLEALAPA